MWKLVRRPASFRMEVQVCPGERWADREQPEKVAEDFLHPAAGPILIGQLEKELDGIRALFGTYGWIRTLQNSPSQRSWATVLTNVYLRRLHNFCVAQKAIAVQLEPRLTHQMARNSEVTSSGQRLKIGSFLRQN